MGMRTRVPAPRPGVSALWSRSPAPQVSKKKRVSMALTSFSVPTLIDGIALLPSCDSCAYCAIAAGSRKASLGLLARRLRIRHAEEREFPQVIVVRLEAVGG